MGLHRFMQYFCALICNLLLVCCFFVLAHILRVRMYLFLISILQQSVLINLKQKYFTIVLGLRAIQERAENGKKHVHVAML